MAKLNNLKKYREEVGLSQAELSRLSDLSEKTIRDIENNRKSGAPTTLHRIVYGLNKSNHKTKERTFEEVFPQT